MEKKHIDSEYEADENDGIKMSKGKFELLFGNIQNLKTPDLIHLLETKIGNFNQNIKILELLNSKSDFSTLEKIFVLKNCFPKFETGYIENEKAKIISDFFLGKDENEKITLMAYFISVDKLQEYFDLVALKQYSRKLQFLEKTVFTQNIIEKINFGDENLKKLTQEIYKIYRNWLNYEDTKILMKIFSYQDGKLWNFLSDNQKDATLKHFFQFSGWEKHLLDNPKLIYLFETNLTNRKNFVDFLTYYKNFESFWEFGFFHYHKKTLLLFKILKEKYGEKFCENILKRINKKLDQEEETEENLED